MSSFNNAVDSFSVTFRDLHKGRDSGTLPVVGIEAGCVGGVLVLRAQAGTLRLAPGWKKPFSWHSEQM